jgi:hypothetical protein
VGFSPVVVVVVVHGSDAALKLSSVLLGFRQDECLKGSLTKNPMAWDANGHHIKPMNRVVTIVMMIMLSGLTAASTAQLIRTRKLSILHSLLNSCMSDGFLRISLSPFCYQFNTFLSPFVVLHYRGLI